jgi:outer membrane protein assembly factor BamA
LGILVMRLLAICLAIFAARAWSGVSIPDAGHLGSGRIEDLIAVPDDLARKSRDDREAWRQEAQDAVVSAAHADGRLEASCEIVLSPPDSASDRQDVRVNYDEGPQYRFGQVQLLFPDKPDSTIPLPNSLPARPGQPFQQSGINALLQQTQQFYRHKGWLDATVLYTLDTRPDSHFVDVKTEVRLGRVAVFDSMQIVFHGEKHVTLAGDTIQHLTPASRFIGLWHVARGDTIRNEDIALFNRKLAQTRLFSQARVTRVPSESDSSKTEVVVDIAERTPGSGDLSLFWEPTFGWGVGAVIQHRNIGGTFNNPSVQFSMAQGMQTLRVDNGIPLLFGTPVALDVGGAVQQQEAGLGDSSFYRESDISADGTFSYQTADWSTVSFKLGTQRDTKYMNPDSSGSGGTQVAYEYTTDLGEMVDFRNEPFDPTRGWMVRGDVGWGGRLFPSDTSFVWLQAQSRYYQPLFWRFYSAAALDGGEFLNPTTFDGSKIFWLGGPRSVRSYGFDDLRAVAAGSGIGLQPRYLRASGELRMNLPWGFQAVGFLDWARIWSKGENADLFDLDKAAIGYGTGLRFHISLLTLRLDYSFGRGSDSWAFDLAQAI